MKKKKKKTDKNKAELGMNMESSLLARNPQNFPLKINTFSPPILWLPVPTQETAGLCRTFSNSTHVTLGPHPARSPRKLINLVPAIASTVSLT